MGPDRRRAAAAIATAQSDPRGSLWSAAIVARRMAGPVTGPRQPVVPETVPRHARTGRRVRPSARRRPWPVAGRTVARAGRSYAGAVGRGLRVGEPDRLVTESARGVPRLSRAAARRLLPRASRWLDRP